MGRKPALDGARALAVALVVLYHAGAPGFAGGFIGVDIFFVLSGYLITGILLREAESTGKILVGRFLLRRAFRLYPPLLMLLTAVILIGPLFWPDANLGAVVLIAALYLSDYASALVGGISVIVHTWSLSVEEHFYLIWPLAVMGLVRLSRCSRFTALAVAFLAATAWRLVNAWYFPEFSMTAFRFDTRMSGLLLGALLAVTSLDLRRSTADGVGLFSLAALAMLAAALQQDAIFAAFLQPMIDIAALGLIASLTVANSRIGRAFAWPPIVYIGLVSYSIYLWHFPISLIAKLYTDDWRIDLAVTLGLSIAISALSYAFVERPVQAWRQRRFAVN